MDNFDILVWDLIKKVPKGKVVTYKSLALKLNTNNFRRIGLACKKSPGFEKGVPCHRVVSSNGFLHGFNKGLERKKFLLEKEGFVLKKVNDDFKIVDFENKLFKL